jgi:hypothetical protein
VIVDIAIISIILGYVAYVVLITRAGSIRRKKNALANLEKLYQLYHNQSTNQRATIHQSKR